MDKINGLPLFKADILGFDNGIYSVALVEYPAVESNWQAFSKQEPAEVKEMKFSIADEAERQVFGVLMRADFPIYRFDPQMGEFYIVFTKDVIERAVRKFLQYNANTSVNVEHTDQYLDGVLLEQVFIKDSTKGISPKGFEDIEEGSLFGIYKVENDGVWESIKRGDFKGFSIEGFFHVRREIDENKEDVEINTVEDLLDALKKLVDVLENPPSRPAEQSSSIIAAAAPTNNKAQQMDPKKMNQAKEAQAREDIKELTKKIDKLAGVLQSAMTTSKGSTAVRVTEK